MPPTFLLFLACMGYLIVMVISLIIFIPMLLFAPTRLPSTKVIITVFISLPCLLTTDALLGLLFLLPTLLFSWLIDNNYIPQIAGTILSVAGLVLFLILLGGCSINLWNFLRRVIYKQLEKKPEAGYLDNNKSFTFIQRYFNKLAGKHLRKHSIIKITTFLLVVPALGVGCLFFYERFSNTYDEKPTQFELIGKYHLSKSTAENISITEFSKYKLEFRRDSTFILTPLPGVEVCNQGKYQVDYQFDGNEITFRCAKAVTSAHIDRHLNYYRIEFIIGDPDEGESFYFEKDK